MQRAFSRTLGAAARGAPPLILGAALAALGCAAGTDTSTSGSTSGTGLTHTVGTGTGGASGTGGTGGGTGGTAGGGTGGAASGTLDLCVLNSGKPNDPCDTTGKLDFGSVAGGTQVMRLFRIDNGTADDVNFKGIAIASPDFSVVTVRYEQDPGDPNALIRVLAPLPVVRPPGKSLYFEVTVAGNGAAGPLPADKAVVSETIGGTGTETTVPIIGDETGCPAGKAACDADPNNGCETDTNTSLEHCGGCGKVCSFPNASASCMAGVCTMTSCNAVFQDCNGDPLDGCEANIFNDPTHCGSCANNCTRANTTSACLGGNCAITACIAPFAACNLSAGDGCETDTSSSKQNCGGCNLNCDLANASETCTNGQCLLGACDPGFFNCDNDPKNGCEINLQTDPMNCGACNKGCFFNNASATCNAGNCAIGACNANTANCNGNDLDGCEANLLTDVQHCGACGTDCNVSYPHSIVGCTGTCNWMGCQPGYYDINNNLADGCEYQCNKTSTTDSPDDLFADANCDGIDGDVTQAIFVATSGNDGNPGTMALPAGTVNGGIAKAIAANKKQVYISEGTYIGRVTLANGVSLYGGYSQANGWKRSPSYVSIIRDGTVAGGRVTALDGANITQPTTVDRLTIRTDAAVGSGASNYAMYCTGCTGVSLRNSVVDAGAGAAGTSGTNGAAGAGVGSPGSQGGLGSCDGSTPGFAGTGGISACGTTGGNGGAGGQYGPNNGGAGATGIIGTPGGAGGGYGDPGKAGGGGSNGTSGGAGTNGAAGTTGSVVGGVWVGVGGANGTNGAHGNGGGGGGGGGGQQCTFCIRGPGDGGGGGGGGGCGGLAASGGTAGGGSFGVFLVGSTGFVLFNNTISSANGGNGGNGGTGGSGTAGGAGAAGGSSCPSEVGPGGKGGNGGSGGRGGHGGGGAGGPSWAVYRFNTTVPVTGNTLTNASGGSGGFSPGNSGAAGASGQAF